MTAEEEFIFRRKLGYNWEDWNLQSALPIGYAAFASFLVGWAGAIVSFAEVYPEEKY